MKKASEESAVVFFDVDGTLIEGEHPPSVQVARSTGIWQIAVMFQCCALADQFAIWPPN